MSDPYNPSQLFGEKMELHRRIGFAKGQIREAMGLLDGRNGYSDTYWAYKALVCALDALSGPLGHSVLGQALVPHSPEYLASTARREAEEQYQ